MKALFLLLLILVLSGCANLSNIVDSAAEANDKALYAAKFTICKGASIGSVIREFDTEEKAKAWKELCTQENGSAETILSN